MKAGRTLSELAAELERQQATARDFRAPAKQVSMTVREDENPGPDKHKSGILTELIKGHDLSQWGLSNAITAYAQHKDLSYETATELERAGGEIITLAKSQWATIAQAA